MDNSTDQSFIPAINGESESPDLPRKQVIKRNASYYSSIANNDQPLSIKDVGISFYHLIFLDHESQKGTAW